MVYVTSDLHGYALNDFIDLLGKAGFGEDDFLFILGDVIDRNGDGGIALLQWIMMQPNVELLLGNHEALLLDCAFLFEEITEASLDSLAPDQLNALATWLANGASPTLESLRTLNRRFPDAVGDILDFLREAPLYETVSTQSGDYILAHAGLGGFRPDKRMGEYTKHELIWYRPPEDERWFEDITTVFGHTPVMHYSGAKPGRAYRTDTWIDIDTGAAGGGAPMLLRLDDLKEFYP